MVPRVLLRQLIPKARPRARIDSTGAADLACAIAEFLASAPAERRRRAERACDAVAPLAWSRERERLLATYRELLTV